MKRSAFTLLEIVIVIIIIGVLASLALPRMFNVIEGSKITEALSEIAMIRSAMERCKLMNNNSYYTCNWEGVKIHAGVDTVIPLDIGNPIDDPSAYFYYFIGEWANRYVIGVYRKKDDESVLIFWSDTGAWQASLPYKSFVPNASPL